MGKLLVTRGTQSRSWLPRTHSVNVIRLTENPLSKKASIFLSCILRILGRTAAFQGDPAAAAAMRPSDRTSAIPRHKRGRDQEEGFQEKGEFIPRTHHIRGPRGPPTDVEKRSLQAKGISCESCTLPVVALEDDVFDFTRINIPLEFSPPLRIHLLFAGDSAPRTRADVTFFSAMHEGRERNAFE